MGQSIGRRLVCTCGTSCLKGQSLYTLRPELDFDFLFNKSNLELIKRNIQARKGVGNIELVHALWQQIQEFSTDTGGTEKEYKNLWDELYKEALLIPNSSHPEVQSSNESDPKVVRFFGTEKIENPSSLTAESIAQSWRVVSYPRKACGNRSYALIGPLADLEWAIVRYVWSFVLKKNFRPVSVSDVLSRTVTDACGLQQRSEHDIQYILKEDDSLCLSGTSEMGISNMLRSKMFQREDLPLKLTALSRCYRPEVSNAAHEARLYRVHEFTKIEMFVVCEPKDSSKVLQELVDIECEIFESLGLHCRLLDMPSQDLGAAAARKFDIEAWMPGRGVFGELSSASNCTDYQARRLGLKYRDENGKATFVHTCNGTAVATSRAVIALLETFQKEKKGLKELPEALKKFMPKKRSSIIKMHPALSLNPY